jgi:GNAT superfamily N-acetyltransferase
VPQLSVYSKEQVPRDMAVQMCSYVRIQWPFLMGQATPLWRPQRYPDGGRHFMLHDDDVLIAHALSHHREIAHVGRTWRVGALSGVFTYPTHRGSGFGEQVVAAATKYLRESETDFALLFCGERVKSLYERQGWEHSPAVRVTSGNIEQPVKYEEEHVGGFVLVMYVSEAAKGAREAIESRPIHVGQSTW